MTQKLEGLTRAADAAAQDGPNPLKGKKLKVIIPEGTHTIYDHINPDGTVKYSIPLYPGDVVDADRVIRAAGYVERGQVEVID